MRRRDEVALCAAEEDDDRIEGPPGESIRQKGVRHEGRGWG